MNKIFFSADTHIGHKNILNHKPLRPHADSLDIQAHDKWIIDLWRKTISKHDRIYFAGDLTFYNSANARNLLSHLTGEKYLAAGNHDDHLKAHLSHFQKVAQIIELTIKPSMCDCLPEDLNIVLCHYPLLDWPGKRQGAIMLHGHCHGSLDDYNAQSADLRFDVGIDGVLAQKAGGFIDLPTLYEAILEKTSQRTPRQYATEIY